MNDDETSLKTSSFLSYSFKYSCPRWFSYNLRPTSLFFFFHFILPFHSDKCYLYTASIILLGDVLGAGHSVPREVNNHNNNNNSRPSLKKKKKKKVEKVQKRVLSGRPRRWLGAIILINRQQIPLSLPLPRSFAYYFLQAQQLANAHSLSSRDREKRERDRP